MSVDQHEEVDYDLRKPRLAVGGNLKVAHKKVLHFYQTRSNAIALFIPLPAICIENVVCMKTGEELYCKVHHLLGYCARPYSRRICIMDVRNFPISKREHPPTIKANEARSKGKPVA